MKKNKDYVVLFFIIGAIALGYWVGRLAGKALYWMYVSTGDVVTAKDNFGFHYALPIATAILFPVYGYLWFFNDDDE